MILEFLLGLLSIVFLFYIYWTWNYSYWKKNGVPSIEPSFPFGNIKDVLLMRRTIAEVYDKIYWTFPDKPVCGFYKLWQPILMIRDPELVKAVLVKEFNSFHDNDYYVNPEVDPILGLNPFNAKGERWKMARGIITPSLTPSKIKDLIPYIKDSSKAMVEYLKKNENVSLEAYDMIGKYTTDVVSKCAYGIDFNSYKDPNNNMRTMSSKIFDGGFTSNLALLFAFYAPKLGDIFKLKIMSNEVSDYFINIIKEAADSRLKSETTRNDYLQTLIEARLSQFSELDYVELAANCMSFFLDGYETAAILSGFILYELAENENVQIKLREEIKSAGLTIDCFNYENIHQLDYLERVISEALRKHPPGTTTTRVCTKDVTLSLDNFEVHLKKGTPVVLPMYSIHNDYTHFSEPEVFDPERFTPENKALRHDYCYFPFGAGPRSCPGFKFALSMVKMSLVAILLELQIITDTEKKKKIEMDPMNTFFHSAKGGLWLKFRKLNDLNS